VNWHVSCVLSSPGNKLIVKLDRKLDPAGNELGVTGEDAEKSVSQVFEEEELRCIPEAGKVPALFMLIGMVILSPGANGPTSNDTILVPLPCKFVTVI
jgi:hypothetical protein